MPRHKDGTSIPAWMVRQSECPISRFDNEKKAARLETVHVQSVRKQQWLQALTFTV